MNWKGKKVLVTGSEGMIGKELVIQLTELGADVKGFDIKDRVSPINNVFDEVQCLEACMGIDYVFHLFGVKGNPRMTSEQPMDFIIPMLRGDLNMIDAAQQKKVKGFLYTSSIAVENPETDEFPAWAKLTAEKLIKGMQIQYPKGTKYCVVRPANVFGRYDDFDNPNAMVVTSLIEKALEEEQLEVWGDGQQIRDFIPAKDVARGMIKTMEAMPKEPINLCRGVGVKIRDVANMIVGHEKTKAQRVYYSPEKKVGAESRIMEPNHKKIGLEISPTSFIDNLEEVIDYASNQHNNANTQ